MAVTHAFAIGCVALVAGCSEDGLAIPDPPDMRLAPPDFAHQAEGGGEAVEEID